MDQKVLILGANGMLGHELAEVFFENNPILWDKAELDITKKEDVFKKLSDLKPTLIINSAAYTDVDGAESNVDLAMKINGEAIGYLAEAAKALGAIFIHFSTDYVFDGEKKQGYIESDKPNPINVYGESKLLGENLLQEKGEMYYLIRSSWLYGKNGKNFVDTILNKAKTEKFLSVVNDQIGHPTYSKDLAEAVKNLIEKSMPCGIYHLSNETEDFGVSWYDFAKRAISIKALNTEIRPCATKDFPRPAKRPKFGALVNTKFVKLRDWQTALADYLSS